MDITLRKAVHLAGKNKLMSITDALGHAAITRNQSFDVLTRLQRTGHHHIGAGNPIFFQDIRSLRGTPFRRAKLFIHTAIGNDHLVIGNAELGDSVISRVARNCKQQIGVAGVVQTAKIGSTIMFPAQMTRGIFQRYQVV